MKIFEKIFPNENEFNFERRREKLAQLLKEIHNKIINSEINNREDLIAAYEEKMNQAINWFPFPDDQRVKSYFDRYNLILERFDEYKEKGGDL